MNRTALLSLSMIIFCIHTTSSCIDTAKRTLTIKYEHQTGYRAPQIACLIKITKHTPTSSRNFRSEVIYPPRPLDNHCKKTPGDTLARAALLAHQLKVIPYAITGPGEENIYVRALDDLREIEKYRRTLCGQVAKFMGQNKMVIRKSDGIPQPLYPLLKRERVRFE